MIQIQQPYPVAFPGNGDRFRFPDKLKKERGIVRRYAFFTFEYIQIDVKDIGIFRDFTIQFPPEKIRFQNA